MSDAPFEAWIAHWLHDEPEMRLARVFAGTFRRRDALFGIERELAESAYGVRDNGVAQARLGWWMEECTQLAARAARHPLTRELQGQPGDDHVATASALGRAFTAAFALVEAESIGTVDELVALDHEAFAPFVRLRARATADDGAVRAATSARLLLELRDWQRFAQPARARVPLQALARAGVDREGAVDGAAAIAAQEALVGALAPALAADVASLDALDGARTVVAPRLVRAKRDHVLGERSGNRFGLLLALWAQARRHRH
ncbi:MAG TPA: hypothetical protein VFL14_11295 [Xanthomonadales bacterium]|nr:hypothetical protein [Xanthomonadales bacterium]